MTATRKLARLFAAALAISSATWGSADARAELHRVGEARRAAFPSLSLAKRQAAGQEAIDQLGLSLPSVAAWYGKTAPELSRELLSDRRMRVDRTGRLLFVEDMDAPVAATAPTAAETTIQNGALASLDQTFLLHSRPGASRTIYLNFAGATIANTAWNNNGNTITAQPFDFDGNPAVTSDAELQRIQYIWQRVAEDYAPFDVDVTTEQPAQNAITRSGTADQIYGTTVVITNSAGVYSCNCGGIAYVGVFNDAGGSHPADYYKPALVFYDKLGNGSEKPVAEAISHEAGHNMGLHHDGTASEAYYAGQGTDPVTGWAPIMGVGYYKPLVQFSKGEYAGANNKEDDFAIAQSFGLPLRNDDFGDTPTAAEPLEPSIANGSASVTVDGVTETGGDRDVFEIAGGAGVINASVAAASRSGNADLVLSVLDANGTVLASANPLNALGASLSYSLPAQGTYYLEVRSTGQGDAATTGYSAYGSVGNYRLAATYAAPAGVAPVAVLTAATTSGAAPLAVTLDGTQSTDDGDVAFWYWDFGDGTSDQTGTMSSVGHVYRSAGSFVARLTVVDDTGLRASATQTINVAGGEPQAAVQGIQMTVRTTKRGATARAVVTIINQDGQVIPGAVVQAQWSGAANKAATGHASNRGRASFSSPASKAGGCFTLTVTGVTASGYTFSADALPAAQVCG